ncbi:MAG: peptidase M61 [Asticcacaulis sp.]
MSLRGLAGSVVLVLAMGVPVVAQPFKDRPAIPASQDIPYAGTLKLSVDATDTQQRIIRVRQVIPVSQSGPLVLMMPKWLPGKHAAPRMVDKVANLRFSAGGNNLSWLRDPLEVNAFHIEVPEGASEVVAEFEFLSPMTTAAGRIIVTDVMNNLQWELLSFYPAGYYTRQIPIELTLKLPEGWGYGVALEVAETQADNRIVFKPISYDHFIDSPMFAGRHFKVVDLTPKGRAPVSMFVMADEADDLVMTDEQIAIHRKMVDQTLKLFKSEPYDRYSFLVHLSDNLGDIGLEHHRSSENGHSPNYFRNWATDFVGRDLLPHEFVHAWNGKYKRGADLLTADFQTPMQGSLLWVYEGQTQYWGYVLSARSGIYSRDQTLQALAHIAAHYELQTGGLWRPLIDTTNDPVIAQRAPKNWTSWQRSEDYYNAGLLIWLEADTLIREQTRGRKSLDDFAATFFNGPDGDYQARPYRFEDVVAALNAVHSYDWATFLTERLYQTGASAPLAGLERGGYRLVYRDRPSDWTRARERLLRQTDMSHSLGLMLANNGELQQVIWGSPAFEAGLGQGMTLVAVNGLAYDAETLQEAVTAAKASKAPLDLLIRRGRTYRTVSVTYHEGLRYPHLEAIEGKKSWLDEALSEKR